MCDVLLFSVTQLPSAVIRTVRDEHKAVACCGQQVPTEITVQYDTHTLVHTRAHTHTHTHTQILTYTALMLF